jgi:hypothetical protein
MFTYTKVTRTGPILTAVVNSIAPVATRYATLAAAQQAVNLAAGAGVKWISDYTARVGTLTGTWSEYSIAQVK